ncbi:ArpU family transcriptional regulator [Bacillus sp. Bva_UNVM-123]|uniref:ArpU family phage packaging/lysis transcriptional regulator n=1 Tax=Bacillus sp. Bva_UNVM-123 TaxID=2829798 RepID=UPI00391F6201
MLSEIDREKTKESVEAALEKYRLYLLREPEENLPKVTATYSLVFPSANNQFFSSTEKAAIDNVDFERERKEYIERIRKAVNRLNYKEREVIIRRYLEDEEMFDYEIYNDVGLSESKYYKLRARAFYKLAIILGIEVYKKD